MDLEAPADAWYVWLGVAFVSFAIAGVVVSLPSEPAPDAPAAANTIDQVAGSEYGGFTTYNHDADEFRVGPKRLWLRNDGGTSHASIAFGTMTLVRYNESLLAILDGADPEDHYDNASELQQAVERTQSAMLRDIEQWRSANGKLRVRTVVWDDTRVTLVNF